MNVTFRQLKLFLSVVDTGSVSAAAKAMHVTQPTASMQLKEISQAVGLPLYEVISKKIYLTDAGKELAHTARLMLETWESFEQQVNAAKGLVRGKLKVSVVSTAKYFMPKLIGQFCKKHPGIDVALQILNRDGVVQRMRDNLDDLYIMSQPPSDIPLEDQVFLENPLVMIAPQGHPLSKKRTVNLSKLDQERFIMREKELGSNEAIKEAVAAGLGLGVISIHALHGKQKASGVALLEVSGFPIVSQWHLVHSAKKQLSPIALGFKTHLLEGMKNSKFTY